MKNLLILFLLIVFPTTFFAQQSDYFWNNNTKVNLTKSLTKRYITVDASVDNAEDLQKELSNTTIQRFGKLNIEVSLNPNSENQAPENNWAIVRSESVSNSLLSYDVILSETPVYETAGGDEIRVSHLLYVKLHSASDYQILDDLANINGIEILGNNKFMPLWYTLSCDKNTEGNALQMANKLHETGLFKYVQADFLVSIEPTNCGLNPLNDTYIDNQWGLDNIGLNGGTVGLDIKYCEAKEITTGNNNVVVAVIDQGVDKTHDDLTNIYNKSYDIQSGTSPSQVNYGAGGEHGTNVAGIISADHNLIGVAGIAPNCPIMSISTTFQVIGPGDIQKLANGVNYAWMNGADVINCSWRINSSNPNLTNLYVIENAFVDAMSMGRNGLGTVLIFASANFNGSVSYPANFNPDVITVGAISPCGERWSPTSCGSATTQGSNYGPELDIVAPSSIYTTGLNDLYQNFGATSSAAPHVSGVAALILSVNPSLTQKQVSDIIETTAQKVRTDLYNYQTTLARPNGGWHEEVGYGLVDAEAAVLMAQSMCDSQVDLYIRDSPFDSGEEPNTTTGPYIWLSEDIWVRKQNDGFVNQTHQNPHQESSMIQNSYVYVRVTNKSCVPSLGTETLDLRWSKAATALAWPQHWDGSLDLIDGDFLTLPNASAGDVISSQTIPIIQPGEEVILEFPWVTPYPGIYSSINTEDWHFCLLARIVASNDPMFVVEGSSLGVNVRNNNNIAWKNISVLPLFPSQSGCGDGDNSTEGTVVMVGNPTNQKQTYDIIFSVPEEDLLNPLLDNATVKVKFDKKLYNKWIKGGALGDGFKALNKRKFKLKGNTSIFSNIKLKPNTYFTTELKVTYPSNKETGKRKFSYDIVQQETATGEILGGVRYDINKPDCELVDAGSDVTVQRGCNVVLEALPDIACAEYKWFDNNDNLISTERVFELGPNFTMQYKVKMKTKNGCRSSDSMTVTVSNDDCGVESSKILSVSPTPATDIINVDYDIQNTTQANLRLIKMDNSVDITEEIDINSSTKTININNCSLGIYSIILICDDVVKDHKTIIIQ